MQWVLVGLIIWEILLVATGIANWDTLGVPWEKENGHVVLHNDDDEEDGNTNSYCCVIIISTAICQALNLESDNGKNR